MTNGIDAEGCPDVTEEPFTVMDAEAPSAIGVTVMLDTSYPTVALYPVVVFTKGDGMRAIAVVPDNTLRLLK